MADIHTCSVRGGQEENGPGDFPSPLLVLNSAIHLESIEDGLDMLTNGTRSNVAYQRYSNPTVSVLEKKFALMEGAVHSLAVNSGMTAINLIFRSLLRQGDHVVAQHGLYHEISDQLKVDYEHCGVETSFIEHYTVKNFVDAFCERTKMVFVEIPTNPTFFDLDVQALANECTSRGIVLVVDNTLLTHIRCRPLDLGADITVYSLTKSINGHGDVVGGVVSTNSEVLHSTMQSWRDNTGTILDPFSAWLAVRGLRTLPLRLERHEENLQGVLEFLEKEFPFIPVRHAAACEFAKKNRISGGGGVISIDLPDKVQAQAFVRNLRLFRLATTFGNLESLCYHFGSFARPTRDIGKIGIPYGLVRLSIGLEDIGEIVDDLRRALQESLR